ncbi:MAG: hypothetical protein AUK47_24395 [Deltaproteobacteria bacterium CG2_30_63_29]|nr:MAG: hypothetical protein AUK47_24395 [Deltaproteobacteria bacterium CG2_30_63_29]PJB35373.1 MAG: class I SAM-dependent methyltransferase [Deltaproteobacteria bacterium CG_4_9_14_3_um_filter_63_12]
MANHARLDNETYYDKFAHWYERGRDEGYHKLVDDLSVDMVAAHCAGRDVLEVGCGTGALLRRIDPLAKRAVGVDISLGMLRQAAERGLCCVQGTATELPFTDLSFDIVYSFKVLAHVQEIERALAEVARVLRPGGRAFLEFYNQRSLRFLAKKLAGPGKVALDTHEGEVFTRWDKPGDCAGYLPSNLKIVAAHGLRIFTPSAFVHRIPLLAGTFRRAEWFGRSRRPFSSLGGFYVLEVEKA